MSTPYYVILSDSEDENQDVPTIIILSDSEDETPPPTVHAETEEESEEDPEEDHEDEEEDPEEDSEEEEEEHEPEPDSPHHSTSSIPIPAYDPYFPAPSPPVYPPAHHRSDARHLSWVPDVLEQWRQQEGNPFRRIEEPTQAEPHPVTGEPSHHTIPLLVARMLRQENQIKHLDDAMVVLSDPEHMQELQQDVWSLEHHYQNLRDHTEQLTERVAAGPGRLLEFERRLDGLEQNLERLHTLADSMRGYASYILKGDHTPK